MTEWRVRQKTVYVLGQPDPTWQNTVFGEKKLQNGGETCLKRSFGPIWQLKKCKRSFDPAITYLFSDRFPKHGFVLPNLKVQEEKYRFISGLVVDLI